MIPDEPTEKELRVYRKLYPDKPRTTRLEMGVWLITAFMVGVILSALASRAIWQPRVDVAQAEHIAASHMIVDLQLQVVQLQNELVAVGQ